MWPVLRRVGYTVLVVGNPAVSDERPVAFRPTLTDGLALATESRKEQPMCHNVCGLKGRSVRMPQPLVGIGFQKTSIRSLGR